MPIHSKNCWVVCQIWTNPNVGLKMQLKNVKLKLGSFEMTFLTQLLGLCIFDPILGSNNPALFKY